MVFVFYVQKSYLGTFYASMTKNVKSQRCRIKCSFLLLATLLILHKQWSPSYTCRKTFHSQHLRKAIINHQILIFFEPLTC